MKLDIAIDKLNAFKKIAKKASSNELGEFELIDLDNDSFTVKVVFNKNEPKNRVIGFSQN